MVKYVLTTLHIIIVKSLTVYAGILKAELM